MILEVFSNLSFCVSVILSYSSVLECKLFGIGFVTALGCVCHDGSPCKGPQTLRQCKCGWLEQSEQQSWPQVLQHHPRNRGAATV